MSARSERLLPSRCTHAPCSKRSSLGCTSSGSSRISSSKIEPRSACSMRALRRPTAPVAGVSWDRGAKLRPLCLLNLSELMQRQAASLGALALSIASPRATAATKPRATEVVASWAGRQLAVGGASRDNSGAVHGGATFASVELCSESVPDVRDGILALHRWTGLQGRGRRGLLHYLGDLRLLALLMASCRGRLVRARSSGVSTRWSFVDHVEPCSNHRRQGATRATCENLEVAGIFEVSGVPGRN